MTNQTVTGQSTDEHTSCNLIMKGGITSGVVYPRAVVALSRTYRFRRIGGSSAGAIAALLTAAAEFRRAETGSTEGFDLVQKVPQALAEGDNLLRLFSPSRRTKAVFEVGMALVAPDRRPNHARRGMPARNVLRAVALLVRATWLPFAVAMVVALLPGVVAGLVLTRGTHWGRVTASLLFWLPGALVIGLIVAAVTGVRRAAGDMNANGFGLAKGSAEDQAAKPGRTTAQLKASAPAAPAGPGQPIGGTLPPPVPLTDWLTLVTQQVAGLPDDQVLTFGHLWGPQATDWYRAQVRPGDRSPVITDLDRAQSDYNPRLDLKVMTTCLTQGIPYAFPFADDTFHYCPACFTEYFPPTVMDHLARHDRPAAQRESAGGVLSNECPRHPGEPLRRLPHVPDLPVVIAARISLSFPGLISAVPLVYFDASKKPAERGYVVAWFSDGGIASNFPMHFFDTHLPSRPTFGINLADADARYPHEGATMPRANEASTLRERPITSVAQFALAIKNVMQNWPDVLQADAPGFRDRIATVYLPKGLGGLNLQMSPEQIDALGAFGDRAGTEILERFDLDAHRWTRFRVAMNGLSVFLDQHRRNYPDFAKDVPFPWQQGIYDLGAREQNVRDEAAGLVMVADEWQAQGYPAAANPPSPEPLLRFVARL